MSQVELEPLLPFDSVESWPDLQYVLSLLSHL